MLPDDAPTGYYDDDDDDDDSDHEDHLPPPGRPIDPSAPWFSPSRLTSVVDTTSTAAVSPTVVSPGYDWDVGTDTLWD